MTSRQKLIATIASVSVVLVLLGSTALVGWQMFMKRSDSGIARAAANALPIPAAKLASRPVLYRDFVKSRDTLKKFLASPAAQEQGMNVPFNAELEKNALEKLLVQKALEELAEQRNVTVTEEELRQYYSEVLSATSSTTPDVGTYLLDTFGWNEEDFRQNVLKPALLEQRLSLILSQEQSGDPEALNRYIDERLKQPDVVRYVRF
ncbi:MAG: SurA N-terminal domain-containing protein [Patescibacteria group bacterium]|jgi:FKBP-type peptidyl-prolyl cis-trans isomerase (trigger factor)